MKKLSIAKIIDQYGWSYFFIAKEMARYSNHNVKFQKYNDFNYSQSDIILISSPNISGNISNIQIPQKAKALNKIVIGQYSGETNIIYQNIDLIVTISPSLYWSAKELYKTIPVIFLPEAVDTEYFSYDSKILSNPLVIGWAGGPNKNIKRHQLLDELKNCVILKQMNHGAKFFTQDRTLDEMREFYKKIDIFILPSLTECMPRVIMEAMASGKTCIATDVGSNSILLDSEDIISVYPDSLVLKELQEKIDNYKFKGESNRQRVEKYFSWKTVMPVWDVVFESLINKDFDIIQKISDSYIKEWNSQFEVARSKILKAKALGFNYEHETYPKLIQESQYNLSINNFIINILSIYNYWLIKDTCLSIVKYNKIPSNILQIAVTNIKDKVNILQLASKYNIKIEVQVEPQRELKDFGFGEILFKVPYPVMDYLTKYTGKSWKELDTIQ